MSKKTVSVVVPAYNEAESLTELYTRIRAVFDKRAEDFEFILVDDGSTDPTADIMRGLMKQHANITVIHHRSNSGKSVGLMQGFSQARGDILIMMDADLQDQPEDIPQFLDKLAEGFDFVNGWRRDRKDTAKKRFVSKVYNFLTNKLIKCNVQDINCGFKAMTREVYQTLELRGDLHRLIPAVAASQGYIVTEVPVQHEDRKHGVSKYKLLRHRGLLDIIIVAASQTTQNRPFHIFVELAFFIACIAFLSFVAAIFVQGKWFILAIVMAVWGMLTATMLPLFGFLIESLMTRTDNVAWRKKLIRSVETSGDADGASHG